MPTVLPFTGRRRRERAGKSDRSWIKHDYVDRAAVSQVNAYRVNRPDHKVLLIDGNAGDGLGVVIDTEQQDLFVHEIMSRPTPAILTAVADQVGNAEVVLCEKDLVKRSSLYQKFPTAQILGNHKEAPSVIRPDHKYALWVSDPIGPASAGFEPMRQVAHKLAADFIVILNHGSINRINKTSSVIWERSRELYGERIDPEWWRQQLNKRYLALSHVVGQSPNFRFRIMVIADYLADACFRHPFTEIYSVGKVRTVQQFLEEERGK